MFLCVKTYCCPDGMLERLNRADLADSSLACHVSLYVLSSYIMSNKLHAQLAADEEEEEE